MTDKELQDKFLGKRVIVPYEYKGIGSECPVVGGICQFIGHNPILPSWGLYIIIDRFPIQNIDYSQIKIVEDDKSGKNSMVHRPAP